MTLPVNIPMVPDKAAPFTPISNGMINNQLSITLTNAATTLHTIANFGAPSKRIINRQSAHHTWNSNIGVNHNR